jgi:hypothetical protein
LASEARAEIPNNDWRQTSRPRQAHPDAQAFVELRFGPYWPQVDDEPGLSGTPFADAFGTDPQFYFGLEADWVPLRIPYLGALGPGFGWGYTWASGKARVSGCEGSTESCASSDDTSLSIHPMHASLVLRADELMRRTGIPLVPYAKGGFGFGYWVASSTTGTSEVVESGATISGEGVSMGTHLALGGMFSLGWLDGSSEAMLRDGSGLGHAYLFGEWMNASLGTVGEGGMRIGSSTFVTGLAADF